MGKYIFEWDGDHAALNFINTLDERLSAAPLERLSSYAALVSFVHQAGLFDRKVAAELVRYDGQPTALRTLAAAIAFRETVYRLLCSWNQRTLPAPAEMTAFNAAIVDALSHSRLTLSLKGAARTWDCPLSVQRPIWELGVAVDNLFRDGQFARVRKCEASDCGTFFIDRSNPGRRRWCSMSNCGNRNKVRRFRRRASSPQHG
jgi:predicted RNA-binding Zn ribbon-like protein